MDKTDRHCAGQPSAVSGEVGFFWSQQTLASTRKDAAQTGTSQRNHINKRSKRFKGQIPSPMSHWRKERACQARRDGTGPALGSGGISGGAALAFHCLQCGGP